MERSYSSLALPPADSHADGHADSAEDSWSAQAQAQAQAQALALAQAQGLAALSGSAPSLLAKSVCVYRKDTVDAALSTVEDIEALLHFLAQPAQPHAPAPALDMAVGLKHIKDMVAAIHASLKVRRTHTLTLAVGLSVCLSVCLFLFLVLCSLALSHR